MLALSFEERLRQNDRSIHEKQRRQKGRSGRETKILG